MGLQDTHNLIGADERYPVATVNGRFQPFHKGHLEYVLKAFDHCDFLCVGITQYDIKNLLNSPLDLHREKPYNNPLNYFERVEMITEVLLNNGINFNQFSITPFPIDNIEYLSRYVPTEVPVFTTICDEWNINKINILKDNGYTVKVILYREIKKYSGVVIRDLLCVGDVRWKCLVPKATIRVIEKYKIRDRLINASK